MTVLLAVLVTHPCLATLLGIASHARVAQHKMYPVAVVSLARAPMLFYLHAQFALQARLIL